MIVQHECSYLCVVCEKNKIVASCTEETYEGLMPDQSNCDLSTYKDHKVLGGKLLWRPRNSSDYNYGYMEQCLVGKPPFGGICEACLTKDGIKELIGFIRFTD